MVYIFLRLGRQTRWMQAVTVEILLVGKLWIKRRDILHWEPLAQASLVRGSRKLFLCACRIFILLTMSDPRLYLASQTGIKLVNNRVLLAGGLRRVVVLILRVIHGVTSVSN